MKKRILYSLLGAALLILGGVSSSFAACSSCARGVAPLGVGDAAIGYGGYGGGYYSEPVAYQSYRYNMNMPYYQRTTYQPTTAYYTPASDVQTSDPEDWNWARSGELEEGSYCNGNY